MGELLRRYWHPVGMAADAGATPRPVKILGEELILFRDGRGQAGLVYPRCCHRGTTLYYGKVEERGIRCCYHGWLFDVEGRCLEMPCEPNPTGAQCQRVRQPWYPVEERYGLVFAYLGPPDRKPVLPRFECLEVLQPGEFVEADDSSIGSGGIAIAPCNWLQHFENVVDPYHVPILHGSFSGPQFAAQMNAFPKVKFEYGRQSVKATSIRPGPDGKRFRRVTEAVVPTLRVVANPQVAQYGMVESIGWTLPIDDTHYRIYVAGRVRERGELTKFKSRYNGKTWAELTPEEHQKFPGDTEAQVGQGAITFHSEEHLMSSDQGVSMLRILLQKQIDIVASGGNPIGVAFDEAGAYVKFDAGQYLDEASA
jgi:phenylpropionate dioxygenase-like ring-hydroxylating dioxygenase large terminal subunit